MNKHTYPLIAVLSASAFICGCTSNEGVMEQDLGGGVGIEENTFAGIVTRGDGTPVRGAAVLARHASIDTLQFIDTTDQNGAFAFPVKQLGVYGISTRQDSLAYYSTVEYSGKKINIEAELRPVSTVSARVALSDESEKSGIEVLIPGSDWRSVTDSNGYFVLTGVPVGDYGLLVKSPDPGHYPDAMFVLNLQLDSLALGGPLPSDMNIDDAPKTLGDSSKTLVTLPLSTEYGLLSWWPMDYTSVSGGDTVTTDARGRMGATKIYGNASLTNGVVGKAIRFKDASQFGVIEEDNHVLNGLTELTLETFVKINSLGDDGRSVSGQKNIIGKLGFGSDDDQNVFSLALIEGSCGAEKPAFAFFLAQETGADFSCDNAVVSTAEVVENEWIHVVVTWKDGFASIYQNSDLAGSGDVGIKTLPSSNEPIFFGKENLDFELDDVRLGAIAITSADVLYRYYQKSGGTK